METFLNKIAYLRKSEGATPGGPMENRVQAEVSQMYLTAFDLIIFWLILNVR